MMNKINKNYLMLVVIILIQVIYIACVFNVEKQGYHSDELWNYGFANSTEGKHVYSTDVGREPKNCDEWVSTDVLRRYITVDKDEIFNYAAVYKNAANDYNPPLGYMLLHFVCSFFLGKWSKWYCFGLNLACFIIMQIYIYKLARSVTKNENAGLLSVFFFGFTAGACNIVVFLRIYAVAVMFGVMLLYYMHQLYEENNSGQWKLYLKIFLINILGCFTLNLFLPFAFIITVMYCLYYLISKKIKKIFTFGFMMLSSVAISFTVFPSRISQIIGDSNQLTYRAKSLSTVWQNKIYWAYLTNDLFGVHNSIWKTMFWTYVLYGILIAAFFIIPICFLVRKEEKYKQAKKKIKNAFINLKNNIKHIQYTYIVMICTVAFVVLIAAARTSTYAMGDCTTRYIFMIYPVMAVFATTLSWKILSVIVKKAKIYNVICVILCVVFSVLSIILSRHPYFFKHYEEGKTLTQLENNANCIIVTEETWLMTCYTCEIYNTQNYYVTNYDKALQSDFKSDKINENDPLYFILDMTYLDGNSSIGNLLGIDSVVDERNKEEEHTEKEFLEYFNKLEITNQIQKVGVDATFGRPVNIYRLN